MDVVIVSLGKRDEETLELINSIGFRIVGEFCQKRVRGSSRFFVGRGKIEEIKDFIKENHVDMVVFDADLTPSQHYQVESYLGIRCIDRIGIILELFATRARTKESRCQVELARIEYELPLLREWISKKKADERPGFLAGGEYRVDTYYEHARRRKKAIKNELKRIEKERRLRRESRKDSGYGLVSIVGYANAGKSSLFNILSSEEVLVEDRLFSTLSTTTRRFEEGRRILLTDTVGFIKDLPVWLIESFRSTLEEVFLSDVILLLVDGSDPPGEFEKKLNVALDILLPKAEKSALLFVINKIDLLELWEIELRRKIIEEMGVGVDPIFISVKEGTGLRDLVDRLHTLLLPSIAVTIKLPMNGGFPSFLSWLYENSEVMSVSYYDMVEINLRCHEEFLGRLRKRTLEVGGSIDIPI